MTDDEYQRIKDEEKKRLRAKRTLRRLQTALREQTQAGQGAVARMTERVQGLFDEHRAALGDVQWDTARMQARLDALRDVLQGNASGQQTGTASHDASHDAASRDVTPEDEAAVRRHRAERLVDELRAQLGMAPGASSRQDGPPAPESAPESASENDASDAAPPDQAAPDDGLPEKTIGRMSRS